VSLVVIEYSIENWTSRNFLHQNWSTCLVMLDGINSGIA